MTQWETKARPFVPQARLNDVFGAGNWEDRMAWGRFSSCPSRDDADHGHWTLRNEILVEPLMSISYMLTIRKSQMYAMNKSGR